VAGTALQDKALAKCAAIEAPQFLTHRALESPSKAHKLPKAEDRFAYQKVNVSAPVLGHAPVLQGVKSTLSIHGSKHSRFSSQGALYVESRTAGADAFYDVEPPTAPHGTVSMVSRQKHSRFSSQGALYVETKTAGADAMYDAGALRSSAKGAVSMVSGQKHSRFSSQGALYVQTKSAAPDRFYAPSATNTRPPLRAINGRNIMNGGKKGI